MQRMLRCLTLMALWSGISIAWGADRPYLATNSAAAEEDEEQVWSVENWYRSAGAQRSLTVAPEYAFDPLNSLQVEFRRTLDRDGINGHELEVEYKHLFNHIARDGYGWGVVAALDMARPKGGPWTRTAVSLMLPFSLQFGEDGGLLHANVGVSKPREERRVFTGVIAAEREVFRRTTLFAEWARDEDSRLLHGGVRYWIKREQLAVDLAWQRVRGDDSRSSGVVLGIAWYDL